MEARRRGIARADRLPRRACASTSALIRRRRRRQSLPTSQRLPAARTFRVAGQHLNLSAGRGVLQFEVVAQDSVNTEIVWSTGRAVLRLCRHAQLDVGVALETETAGDAPHEVAAITRHDAQMIAGVIAQTSGKANSRWRVDRSEGKGAVFDVQFAIDEQPHRLAANRFRNRMDAAHQRRPFQPYTAVHAFGHRRLTPRRPVQGRAECIPQWLIPGLKLPSKSPRASPSPRGHGRCAPCAAICSSTKRGTACKVAAQSRLPQPKTL